MFIKIYNPTSYDEEYLDTDKIETFKKCHAYARNEKDPNIYTVHTVTGKFIQVLGSELKKVGILPVEDNQAPRNGLQGYLDTVFKIHKEISPGELIEIIREYKKEH